MKKDGWLCCWARGPCRQKRMGAANYAVKFYVDRRKQR